MFYISHRAETVMGGWGAADPRSAVEKRLLQGLYDDPCVCCQVRAALDSLDTCCPQEQDGFWQQGMV